MPLFIALDAVQKKIPGKAGDRFRNPDAANKNRAMNEKITDFVRKQFEKMSGYAFCVDSWAGAY